jgi:hypothetical protein
MSGIATPSRVGNRSAEFRGEIPGTGIAPIANMARGISFRIARRSPVRLVQPNSNGTSLGLILLCFYFAACSSSSNSPSDAAGGTDTHANQEVEPPDDSVMDRGAAVPEVPATDISCNQIRICASDCTNAACVEACAKRGTIAAQALFATYSKCVDPQCSDVGDVPCRCEASCFGGSACETETDDCTGNETDFVCDNFCH